MPSHQIAKERRSKAAADLDAGESIRRRGGSFMKRGALPAKKLSSASIRPTTAGLTPAGRLAAEAQLDAIEADIRAEVAARMGEKVDISAGGATIEVIGRAPGGDFIYYLSPDDLEKEFYACMAQVDLAKEAFNAGLTVEQLVTSRESEAKAKADADASKTAEAGVGAEVVPASMKQLVDDLIASAKSAEAPAGGVKRMSDDMPAPPSKRSRRRKPEDLGTRDG